MKRMLCLLALAFSITGCSTGIEAVDQKMNQIKQAADSEVKSQLQSEVQKYIDQLKANNPQFAAALSQKDRLKIDWNALGNTELVEHSFFSAFGYEYLAVVRGDGTIQVKQRNTNTGEEKVFKEYKIMLDGNGRVQLQ